jgi:hypothetical protein
MLAPETSEVFAFLELPPDVQLRIAVCLHPNEVVASLFLVSKAVHWLLSAWPAVVRLSQPVPAHAFAERFAAPGSTRGLTLVERQKLIALAAASGCEANLRVALAAAGCVPGVGAMCAAAAAGQLATMELLERHGCGTRRCREPSGRVLCPLQAAAAANQPAALEWLLGRGAECSAQVAYAAARGGHVALLQRLLRRQPEASGPPDLATLLVEAAAGCELRPLQALLWRALGPGLALTDSPEAREALREAAEAAEAGEAADDDEGSGPQAAPGQRGGGLWRGGGSLSGPERAALLSASLGSPTPCWHRKAEWLMALGFPPARSYCVLAARRPDAEERMRWMLVRAAGPGAEAHEHPRTGPAAHPPCPSLPCSAPGRRRTASRSRGWASPWRRARGTWRPCGCCWWGRAGAAWAHTEQGSLPLPRMCCAHPGELAASPPPRPRPPPSWLPYTLTLLPPRRLPGSLSARAPPSTYIHYTPPILLHGDHAAISSRVRAAHRSARPRMAAYRTAPFR